MSLSLEVGKIGTNSRVFNEGQFYWELKMFVLFRSTSLSGQRSKREDESAFLVELILNYIRGTDSQFSLNPPRDFIKKPPTCQSSLCYPFASNNYLLTKSEWLGSLNLYATTR